MTTVGSSYRSKKVTTTFALENDLCCDIEIEPIITSEEVFTYDFRITKKSKDSTLKYEKYIEADSKGQANILILCDVIKSIDGIAYKNISIYLNSDYVVKMFHEIFSRNGIKRIEASPNKTELLELKQLVETIGRRHYITVKKEKVLKVYSKMYHE